MQFRLTTSPFDRLRQVPTLSIHLASAFSHPPQETRWMSVTYPNEVIKCVCVTYAPVAATTAPALAHLINNRWEKSNKHLNKSHGGVSSQYRTPHPVVTI